MQSINLDRKEDPIRYPSLSKLRILPCIAGATLLLSASANHAQTYKVIDLGTYPGDVRSIANGVDDAGDVVGTSFSAGSPDPVVSPPQSHAFLRKHDGHGHLIDLGLSGMESQASGVVGRQTNDWDNDRDDERNKLRITGAAGVDPQHYTAYLYQDHLVRYLGDLPGGRYSVGMAVNRRGEVAGVADNENGLARPFLYKNGNLINLGSLADNGFAVAYAINDRGDVVGYSDTPDFATDAFLYTDHQMMDIGGLPGSSFNVASAINNAGQIAGTSSGTGSQAWRWENGIFTTIPPLTGGKDTVAYGINQFGTVVGSADLPDFPAGSDILVAHAFIYDNCGTKDLNDLISSDSGWVLNTAQSINDRGEIVGGGTIQGESHAFLLKPIRNHHN